MTGRYLSETEAHINRFQEIRKHLGSNAIYERAPESRQMFIAEFNAFLDEQLAFRGMVKTMHDFASRLPQRG